VVAGTSSGVGEATVKAFLADGWNVVATARDPAMALRLSLREIGELRKARRSGDLPRGKRIALMKDQLVRLEAKSAELERLKTHVRAKIAWQQGGEKGDEPVFASLR
jgi:NAD(P)-dependent dehydrogenase (short-subunit alcohol dehydrogenase family)